MIVSTGAGFGLTPEQTTQRCLLEAGFINTFKRYGYSEVTLPIFEYYSNLKDAGHTFKDEAVISFTDHSSGKLLALRPDFTPQVSRLVAGYKESFPPPVRVYYRGPVFRNVNISHGVRAEGYHIGLELYAAAKIVGDMELFAILFSCMEQLNLPFKVILGDAGYLSRLSKILGDLADEYLALINAKNLSLATAFVEKAGFCKQLGELLKSLPLMYGSIDEVDKLIELSAFDDELSSKAEALAAFLGDLVSITAYKERLIFDPSESRGLDYYTGINFEIVHPVSGAVFGGGGRYDGLLTSYGMDYTACGLTFYLNEIEQKIIY
jgi:ATP phosphoribosyltransferase regulatory subunit